MLKAAVIGSGNVAHHFVPALARSSSVFLSCLHSQNEEAGLSLCRSNKIAYAKSLSSIPEDTNIIFVMTNDDSISSVTQELSELLKSETIITHFSGTAGLKAIHAHFKNRSSSWPICSISETDTSLDLKKMPICISANHHDVASKLLNIFSEISEHVTQIDEAQKGYLHIGAVITNNFTNQLFHLTRQMLEREGLDFDLLKPIIQQTVDKIMDSDPADVQTGPASRRDIQTINKHQELLESHLELLSVYKQLSKSIINNK